MLTDEIFFRILQASSALAFVMLLINCMSMGNNVRPWLPLFVYALCFMCLVTFLTTFFMRQYLWGVVIVTIAVFSVTCVAAALHRYLEPISQNKRESLNRRILSRILPIVGAFLLIWCIGVAFDGGAAYFVKIESLLSRLLDNQRHIIARQDSTVAALKQATLTQSLDKEQTKQYRNKLDSDMKQVKEELINTNLGLQRVVTNQQKNRK